MLLCIDESGNTQETIALALAAIPDKEIDRINQIFTVRPTDPQEIQTLYYRTPLKSSKPREEFKYSDFRNAEKATGLSIYTEFLKEKLTKVAKTSVQAYFSVFDKPSDNKRRLEMLKIEAQTLIHSWAKNNMEKALSNELEIVVDQQVFDEPYIFEIYERRNMWRVQIFKKGIAGPGVHYGGKENSKEIIERNSKTFKPLQLSDFLVGAFREYKYYQNSEFFDIIKPITKKYWIRDARGPYSPAREINLI